jgi:hypothetical protein
MEELGLGFDDLSRSEDEEVIILKAEKRNDKDRGKRLEYKDTPATNRYRRNLRYINLWIEDAELDLLQRVDEAVADIFERRLHRVFNNGSFKQGGRLWGGFWMNLKKTVRRDDLLISEEQVAELDYGQMALRLLYAEVDVVPPAGDLYSLPGLEEYRDGVKTIIQSALFSEKQQMRMPQGVRGKFPERISYEDVKKALQIHHHAVYQEFFRGRGMHLMFLESEIMVTLLLELQKHHIVGLPLHDGLLVPRSAARATEVIMKKVFLQKAGSEVPVSIHHGEASYNFPYSDPY